MKPVLIATFTLSIFLIGCAPRMTPKSSNAPFEFTLIDTLQGTKNDIYVRAYEWIAKTFTSAKDVIQMNDKEAGKIIAKAVLVIDGAKNMYGVIGKDYIHYTISIDVKDNKYKCVLSDFYHEGGIYGNQQCSGGSLDNYSSSCTTWYMTMNRWNSIKRIGKNDAENNLASLKKYVRTKANDF
jgi:uncharacterized protein with TBP-like fold DUF4468